MADQQHRRVAQALKAACEETAQQAIAATIASGQAMRVHHKNAKFGSRKEAAAAKVSVVGWRACGGGADGLTYIL